MGTLGGLGTRDADSGFYAPATLTRRGRTPSEARVRRNGVFLSDGAMDSSYRPGERAVG